MPSISFNRMIELYFTRRYLSCKCRKNQVLSNVGNVKRSELKLPTRFRLMSPFCRKLLDYIYASMMTQKFLQTKSYNSKFLKEVQSV